MQSPTGDEEFGFARSLIYAEFKEQAARRNTNPSMEDALAGVHFQFIPGLGSRGIMYQRLLIPSPPSAVAQEQGRTWGPSIGVILSYSYQ